MLICPNCKILYEKSTNCIKCGSPLVEKDSSEIEEIKQPPEPETIKETPPEEMPPFQKPAPPPIPTPIVKKEKTETESVPDLEKIFQDIITDDEQSSSDIIPSKTKKQVIHSGKTQKRIPKLPFQKIGIVIVILIGGYLIWSIYSYLTTKKPEINPPHSEKTSSIPPPSPSISPKPLELPVEPKVANKNSEEKPFVSEEKTSLSPSPTSLPVASKTSLPDEKEIEDIKNLFENIRRANLRKDVDLFMSCYSKTFKDRETKKKGVLKSWEDFTYIDLSYDLMKYSISGNTAVVRIEWLTQFSLRASGRYQKSKSLLDVTLNRDPDGWKIQEIKTVS